MRNIEKITKSKLFLIGCGAAMFLNFGCSKSNPLNPAGNCFGGNWASEYTNELQAWSDALTAYSEDPNATTCANYKSAAKGYIDAIEGIYDCIPSGDRAGFDQELKEAKADIDSEECQD